MSGEPSDITARSHKKKVVKAPKDFEPFIPEGEATTADMVQHLKNQIAKDLADPVNISVLMLIYKIEAGRAELSRNKFTPKNYESLLQTTLGKKSQVVTDKEDTKEKKEPKKKKENS